jgi:hypothetical protein
MAGRKAGKSPELKGASAGVMLDREEQPSAADVVMAYVGMRRECDESS